MATETQQSLTPEQEALKKAQQNLTSGAMSDPASILSAPEVQSTPTDSSQFIAEGTGQVGSAPQATGVTGSTSTATAPEQFDASTMEALLASPDVQKFLSSLQAQQGTVSEGAQVDAEQTPSDMLAQLALQSAQIAEAQKVAPVAPRQVEAGELLQGSSVDMAEVTAATQVQAAQADPSKQATVQGQLEGLMQQFEGGNTPAWAAGAMRQANAQLAARGLGASSLAGQAVIQATMESALPIAMADAQTYSAFEQQNLSNRQQTALFAAQQRAQFLGMKFDQEFQTRVANAARISDIANMNFTAEQQVALENARLAQSVDLANLDARQAKVMADAAALTQLDLANLNNRQQAAVQNAQAFLQMDLTNLSNRQQTELFKAQENTKALFTDQAAENAARQFNATSENQTNQFFASLQSNVEQFNAAQRNAMEQFNTDEQNAIAQFNATLEAQRDQFNAQNALIISQANTQWRQQIATADTASQNVANLEYAKTVNALTGAAIDQIWQRERDLLDYAFTSEQNAMERSNAVLLAKISAAASKDAIKLQADIEGDRAKGALVGQIVGGFLGLL